MWVAKVTYEEAGEIKKEDIRTMTLEVGLIILTEMVQEYTQREVKEVHFYQEG